MNGKRWTTLAVASLIGPLAAQAQVVSDDACPKYAVDVAAFATCDDDRVARSDSAAALPAAKQSHSARHLQAADAYALLQKAARGVLVDVRSQPEVALSGRPAIAHLHVPYQQAVWSQHDAAWTMAPNHRFGEELMTQLAARGIGPDDLVVLVSRAGVRSARAADELSDFGYAQIVTIVDGFEGDLGPDQRRSVNGWKNAGLPWTDTTTAALVSGRR